MEQPCATAAGQLCPCEMRRIPDERHVDLWAVCTRVSDARAVQLAQLLSDHERARAHAFMRREHRMRHVVVHGTLRQLLTLYTCVHPARHVFDYGPQGKPLLRADGNAAIHFSLAYSGELAIIAVAAFAVGVDVEELRPLDDALAVAASFFAADEFEALAALPSVDQLRAFYRCWTRKEAFLKATGDGLSLPLASLAVGSESERQVHVLARRGNDEWELYDIDPAPGYVGALAVPRGWHAVTPTVLSGDELFVCGRRPCPGSCRP